MGRVGTRWRDVQQRYYEWLLRRNTGRAWVKALIQKVWAVSWDMWDHRNEVRLGTTTAAQLREMAATNRRIEEEFVTGNAGLGSRDYHWFDKPLTHVLQYDTEHKAQWIASVELARERHANAHEYESATIRRQRDLMLSWTRHTGRAGAPTTATPAPGTPVAERSPAP